MEQILLIANLSGAVGSVLDCQLVTTCAVGVQIPAEANQINVILILGSYQMNFLSIWF